MQGWQQATLLEAMMDRMPALVGLSAGLLGSVARLWLNTRCDSGREHVLSYCTPAAPHRRYLQVVQCKSQTK